MDPEEANVPGTSDDPWQLQTPSGGSGYTAWREPDADENKPVKNGTVEAWARSEGEHKARGNRMRAT